MAHGTVINDIIIRFGSDLHLGTVPSLRRLYRYAHTPPVEHQGRQIGLERILRVVPCPARAPIHGIHHRHIRHQFPLDAADACPENRFRQFIQIFFHKFGVEASYQHQVSVQDTVLPYGSGICQTGIKRIRFAQPSQSRDRGNHFLYRSGTVQFPVLIGIHRLALGQVEDRNAHFGRLQKGRRRNQRIEPDGDVLPV